MPAQSTSLTLAIAASLLLHAALLIWGPHIGTSVETARVPLTATLRALPEPAVAPAVAPAQPAQTAQSERQVTRKAQPSPAPAPKPAPVAATEAVAEPAATSVAALPPQPAPADQAASAPTSAAFDAAQRARPDEAAPDAGSITQYRLALNIAAKKYRVYPRYARERRWEGRVTVHLEFGADGRVTDIRVEKSSGHAILDESAHDMLRKAQLETPVPPALRGRPFAVDAVVVYQLKD